MARWREGADQILVVDASGRRRVPSARRHYQAAMADYQELKQELGLGHYEGRGWRGFHHHATLCIAAYGFLVAERSRFSPSARAGQVALPVAKMPLKFRLRGSPGTRGAA